MKVRIFLFCGVCILGCGLFEPVTADWWISEFCPDPYLPDDADEFIVFEGSGSLDGYAISGPQGGFRFPDSAAGEGRVTVARSGTAYSRSHGAVPDWEWTSTSPSIPDVVTGDPLRLSNLQGTLTLSFNGRPVQEVSWPRDVVRREGQVHYRENGVWDIRPLMIGQSRFSSSTYQGVNLWTFLSPECSMNAYTSLVESARSEILVNVYEFSGIAMAEGLIRAKQRGVEVTVLLEGGPVGGISVEEKYACHIMAASGIPIWYMTTTDTGHAPYRYNHAKYIVVDGEDTLVTTENFGENGFPSGGSYGNRGWGVVIEDQRVADYFKTVFLSDLRGPGIARMTDETGTPEVVSREGGKTTSTPAWFEGASVTPVLSPDSSALVGDLIKGAREEILVEQAYITNSSGGAWNAYLAEVIEASRRGVKARVLLDAYWFSVDGSEDNDEMAAAINRLARSEGLPLEARCAEPASGFVEKIHDKGVIVDGRRVLVSSINWNENSPAFNREAGVIIDHEGVAGYFRTGFEEDWKNAGPLHSSRDSVDVWKIGAALGTIAVLAGLYLRVRRDQ